MAVNIHITIIELNALHTKRQNLLQELDAVIHLLMEAKHWGLRKSRNDTSLNSRFMFFFKCNGDHRDLHSFPTRRSSDLARMRAYCPYSPMVGTGWLEGWRLTFAGEDVLGWEGAVTTIVESPGDRVFVALYDIHPQEDRKSTRLNSSHSSISYAVFCLKKK